MDQKDRSRAIDDYIEAHEKEPNNIDILTKLASAYFADYNYKKCVSTVK